MTTKEIAILIVNWNQKELTQNCIDSLLGVNLQLFDVYLLDNGSDEDCCVLFEGKYGNQIKLFRTEKNLGFTGGNNFLVEKVLEEDYKYIMFLNNDTTVSPEFLIPLKTILDENEATGAVTGKILFMHDHSVIWGVGGIFDSWIGRISNKGYNQLDNDKYNQCFDVDYISGCMFMCRTSILKQIGCFDDSLFAYYEDFDLSMRIRDAGYRLVYTYKSLIYHVAGASGKEFKNKKERLSSFVWYLVSRNHLVVLNRYLPVYIKVFVLPLLLLKYFFISIVFFIRGDTDKFFAISRGIKDFFKKYLCL